MRFWYSVGLDSVGLDAFSMWGRDSVRLQTLEIAAFMTIPGPGPGDHRVAVKRGVTNTGAGIGDQGRLVTPNYGALIGLGVSWRAQLIEKHTQKEF